MNNISLIAAIGKNRELGKNNQLIWYYKEDLQFFKKYTLNKSVVMGLNTFYSLPCILPERENIVLTSKDIKLGDNVLIMHNINDVLEYSFYHDIFIIGGAIVYKEFLDYADYLYLTEIDKEDLEADVYFPSFDYNDFDKTIISEFDDYKHVLYKRK